MARPLISFDKERDDLYRRNQQLELEKSELLEKYHEAQQKWIEGENTRTEIEETYETMIADMYKQEVKLKRVITQMAGKYHIIKCS